MVTSWAYLRLRVVPGTEPDPGNRRAYETAFSAYQAAARALRPTGH